MPQEREEGAVAVRLTKIKRRRISDKEREGEESLLL